MSKTGAALSLALHAQIGRSQQCVEGPSTLKSCAKAYPAQINSVGPIGQRQRFAAVAHKLRRAAVSCLLAPVRPAAVFWGVRAVVVDAVDAVFRRWARSHVRQEGFERMEPARADRNAAPSVPVVVRVVRIGRAAFHRTPTIQGFRGMPPSGVSVRNEGRAQAFSSQAAAGLRVAVIKRLGARDVFIPAFAAAKQLLATLFGVFDSVQDHQPPKLLTRFYLHEEGAAARRARSCSQGPSRDGFLSPAFAAAKQTLFAQPRIGNAPNNQPASESASIWHDDDLWHGPIIQHCEAIWT